MPFASGVIWLAGGLLTMRQTFRRYLPVLRAQAEEKPEESAETAGGLGAEACAVPMKAEERLAEEEKAEAAASEDAGTEQKQEKKDCEKGREAISVPPVFMKIGRNEKSAFIVLALCGIFSAAVGYFAAVYALSPISYLKLLFAHLVLSCIAVTDWELMIIPNACVLSLLGARILSFFAELIFERGEAGIQAVSSLIALVAGLVILLLLKQLTRGGIGFGDVKLLSALGFLCGVRALCYVLTLSVVLCALISLPFLFFRRAGIRSALPLGPFIYLGFGASILLGAV